MKSNAAQTHPGRFAIYFLLVLAFDALIPLLESQLLATYSSLRAERKHGHSRACAISAPHRRWCPQTVKFSRKRFPDRGGIHPGMIRPLCRAVEFTFLQSSFCTFVG
jgi:hypothetical protein